ncbi:MAG TPA: sigma-70 family RNA polymerase sigma factor [Niabella sp.]|nr:sigma-70 family RNA polymerase sigma factor [Niabella sp.]HOZ97872.1 sigma-70 family RNA polymerase sigma factor [Niabella sp.]HQW13731.1 sigma-70 family RNA polymerase sigma factor [Niabella sp.]HQX19126.1 sigma-70 family RNA polymerase sigma factor [Niabella sp.]HQX41288.1 sigma-70 family RNA polymerase sigma factor [Niabella sp.]
MMDNVKIKSLFSDVCLTGNMDSFNLLYKLLCQRLIRFSAAITGSYHQSEEIVSDIFIIFWQKRSRYYEVQEPIVFLYTCTKNLSLNKIKQNKKYIDFDLLDQDVLSITPKIEGQLITSQVGKIIEMAIRELPLRCQLIFRLVKMDGLSYKQVAELLDISVKTVDAQLAIAIKKLSSVLKAAMPSELVRSFLDSE